MRSLVNRGLALLLGMLILAALFDGAVLGQDASPVATPWASPVVLGGCDPVSRGGGGSPVTETAPNMDPTTRDLDLLYIDVLIPHYETAVTMAGIAQARSTRPEIVGLAAGMAEASSRALDQLHAWREAWYPDVPVLSETQIFAGLETKAASPGRGGAPGLDDLTVAGMSAAVAELCAETDEFDLVFIDEMVEHLTGAVLLSELVAVEAVNPDLGSFAQEVVDSQGSAITTLLGWRDAWYGGVPSDPQGGDEGTPTA